MIRVTARQQGGGPLEARLGARLTAALRRGSRTGAAELQGRIVEGLGAAGRPRNISGGRGLAGAVRARSAPVEGGAEITVGVLASARQGRILEFGGPVKGFFVRPVNRRALAWPVGTGRVAMSLALSTGSTPRQATSLTRRLGASFAFSMGHKISPRYQQAMPYVRPELEAMSSWYPALLRGMIAPSAEATE